MSTSSVTAVPDGVEIRAPMTPEYAEVLTPEALRFVAKLERAFRETRAALLRRRADRQAALDGGITLDFLPETARIRADEWTIAPFPAILNDRRVEITGPTDRKMVINALNSGARVFMADFEDANSPTWDNQLQGQANLMDRWAGKLAFTDKQSGKSYALSDKPATLLIRPRGWHLDEAHMLVDGKPMSGSLFDFGLYVFHNAKAALAQGSGPYFYLPKLESHTEARLW